MGAGTGAGAGGGGAPGPGAGTGAEAWSPDQGRWEDRSRGPDVRAGGLGLRAPAAGRHPSARRRSGGWVGGSGRSDAARGWGHAVLGPWAALPLSPALASPLSGCGCRGRGGGL